jgi:hypothetical protein
LEHIKIHIRCFNFFSLCLSKSPLRDRNAIYFPSYPKLFLYFGNLALCSLIDKKSTEKEE